MNHRTSVLVAALAGTILFACNVKAATIGIDTVSVHIPHESYLSGLNPGAYVRFENGLTGGAYRNSFDRLSLWAGYTAEAGPFALTVGAVSGYQMETTTSVVPCRADQLVPGHTVVCTYSNTLGNTHGPIGLLLTPSFRLPTMYGVTPRISLLPKFSAKGHTVLHLSAEF